MVRRIVTGVFLGRRTDDGQPSAPNPTLRERRLANSDRRFGTAVQKSGKVGKAHAMVQHKSGALAATDVRPLTIAAGECRSPKCGGVSRQWVPWRLSS